MDQPILFLDIDGVCNCRSFLRANRPKDETDLRTWAPMLNKNMVARINRITDEAGADIVVVSDWRGYGETNVLYQTLREGGLTGNFIGVTPIVHQTRRDIETSHWIGQTFGWGDEARISELRFAAIDDNAHLYPTIRGRVIQTSYETGITDGHVRMALKMMKEPIGEKVTQALRPSSAV